MLAQPLLNRLRLGEGAAEGQRDQCEAAVTVQQATAVDRTCLMPPIVPKLPTLRQRTDMLPTPSHTPVLRDDLTSPLHPQSHSPTSPHPHPTPTPQGGSLSGPGGAPRG